MRTIHRQAFSPSAATGRRQRGERPAVLVGAVVLMWWAYLVLGSNLPWLLAAIGVTVIAIWLLREHRGVAACVAIGAVTAAVPAVTCVILIDRQVSGAADMVAVLTGYILVAPVPALVACALRPVLVTVPVNALLGSGVLLLGAVPGVVFGDHGEGAAVLIAALTLSVALIWYRHRRAATALLAALPLVNGWTDLGRRTLPDGSRIDQLLVGQGQAIACLTSSTAGGVERDALAAARAASATAAALGLSGARVQPVILSDREKPRIERYLVNDGRRRGVGDRDRAPAHRGRDPAGTPPQASAARGADRGPAAPPRRAEHDEMTTHEEHVSAAADAATGPEQRRRSRISAMRRPRLPAA